MDILQSNLFVKTKSTSSRSLLVEHRTLNNVWQDCVIHARQGLFNFFFSVFYLAAYDSFLLGSKISNHTFEVQFSPPKPGAHQTKNLKTTVNRRGLIREFDMKKGAWNIIITSHSSMLLLVSLPICQILKLRNKVY